MRGRVRRLRPDRTCPSTATVRAFRSRANAADANADPQSIQSQYRAAADLHTKHNTFDTKRNTIDTKHDTFDIKRHSTNNAKQRPKRRGHSACD
jgi:hypothetical protein